MIMLGMQMKLIFFFSDGGITKAKFRKSQTNDDLEKYPAIHFFYFLNSEPTLYIYIYARPAVTPPP